MRVTIVSPEKTLYEGACSGVKLPGESGSFEVLEDHAPIISTLSAGIVSCVGENPFEIKISSGFVEVARDVVSVCIEV
mgnify:FL=1